MIMFLVLVCVVTSFILFARAKNREIRYLKEDLEAMYRLHDGRTFEERLGD